jgi:hypothetical protein
MSSEPVRVMVEQGKKRAVASAIDWPGWGRSAKLEDPAMALLDEYRPRYALVAARAGLGAEFDAAGELEIVERLPGTGMSEFYGVSGQKLDSDLEPMTEAECERRIAILRACWATFDDVAARVSPDLRPGPRGGGRDRDRIIRHTNGAELDEHAKKVGIVTPLDALGDPVRIAAHRDAFVDAIREHCARGVTGRSWTLQFLIRRCSWHFLDHAWEMEDRDLTGER